MNSCSLTLLASCVAAPALFGQSIVGVEAMGSVGSWTADSTLTDPIFGEPSGGAGWHSDASSAGDIRGSFLSAGTVLDDPGAFFALSTYAATSSQNHPTAAVEASVTAMESFLFEGPVSRTFTLGVDLDGAFANSRLHPSLEAGNFATVSVLRGGAAVDPLFIYASDLSDWLAAGYELVDRVSLEQSDVQTLQKASVEITAHPGDTLHIFAQAFSRMFGPNGVADASSTLTVGWVGDVSGLSSLSGAGDLILIPEPQAFALFAAGFAGLVLLARRRR